MPALVEMAHVRALIREAAMSFQAEMRSHRAARPHRKRTSALAAPFAMANDAQVLTFREWCQLNRISERTGRRLLASGMGPVVVQLAPKRIGITLGANRTWQEARSRGGPPTDRP
jgi:hypothetical protein